jgi:hypothetical protein
MNEKTQILNLLNQEFNRWDELLLSLPEEQITNRQLPSNLSIQDVIAHLWAWQQRSIARLQAGLQDKEPEFPTWPEGFNPEIDDVDGINAWILETCREKPWSTVYADWKAGFLHFLELGQAIPEKDLLDPGRYAWMDGQPLSLVLTGSYEHHHQDHLEPLLAWLRQTGSLKAAG